MVAFCDDHFPQEGWLEVAHFGFRQVFPDGFGVLCFNEGLDIRGSKACVTLTNKETIKHLLGGVWYDTAYHQYRVDVDLARRAAKTGRYMYCADAIVKHEHKGLPMNYPERWEHDKKVFDERWGVPTVDGSINKKETA
jgi:GT2 family glycosyltransferase